MKLTKSFLRNLIKEELLKEFYSEKDFDPKQSRNRNWDGRVTWNQGFIEVPTGKMTKDRDGNPVPKTRTERDIRTGVVQSIIPGYGTVIGIAKIIDDSTGKEVEVEIAELTKS
tara:strand:+ start:5319 stop:5657 length:339 start_codon:yes stop_codon:yes gene_type:complete